MTVKMTVRAMNAATAILRPCDSLAAAMDGYSPERSGSDLLMQSAGLLILCHMREETTGKPTNFPHDGFVEDRFIGRIHRDPSIVRIVRVPVKSASRRQLIGGDRLWFSQSRYRSADSNAVTESACPPHHL